MYTGAIAAGIAAFVGGSLTGVFLGSASLGAIILIVAMFSALALSWTVRLG